MNISRARCAGACLAAVIIGGCGQTSPTAPTDDSLGVSEEVLGFSGGSKLTLGEKAAASRSTVIELSPELVESLDFGSLMIEAGPVVTEGGDRAAKGSADTLKPDLTLKFSDEDDDPCESPATVHPVETLDSSGERRLAATADRSVRDIVRHGRFAVCAEVQGNPHETVEIENITFSGGRPSPGRDRVTLCHTSRRRSFTIAVSQSAVDAHLAHGDTLGPCPEGSCAQSDIDLDGVNDCIDECVNAVDVIVSATGCPAAVFSVDAGEDVTVRSGDTVTLQGTVQVAEGEVAATDFQWTWEQISGPSVGEGGSGPNLTFDTVNVSGDLVFRLTVSLPSGETASDEVTVHVEHDEFWLASGKWHNALLDEAGHLQLWGWNSYGQLGDGSASEHVVSVAAAYRHTLVAMDDGTVLEFGRGTMSTSSTPVVVPGVSNAVQVAALHEGGLVLTADGVVMGFDLSADSCALAGATSIVGALGFAAVPIPGVPDDVVEIAAGNAHGMALTSDGTAWVWGSRFGCQPRPVLGNVVTIAAGGMDFCLFVREDGTAWSMGFNLHGGLGNGTTVPNYDAPTQVVGLSDVWAVAAGERHSLFVTRDGSLWATGWNRYCQLGLEAELTPETPEFGVTVTTPVQVDLHDVIAVSGGDYHTIAMTGDGRVWGWGLNTSGQISGGLSTNLPGTTCMPSELELP